MRLACCRGIDCDAMTRKRDFAERVPSNGRHFEQAQTRTG
jgi:hypothetical protein